MIGIGVARTNLLPLLVAERLRERAYVIDHLALYMHGPQRWWKMRERAQRLRDRARRIDREGTLNRADFWAAGYGHTYERMESDSFVLR